MGGESRNVVKPDKTSGIRPAKLRCNGLHHVFDGDMSGKFMECFRYGHLTNFINKKMWSRWDLLQKWWDVGGLSLTWSENFPTGTTALGRVLLGHLKNLWASLFAGSM